MAGRASSEPVCSEAEGREAGIRAQKSGTSWGTGTSTPARSAHAHELSRRLRDGGMKEWRDGGRDGCRDGGMEECRDAVTDGYRDGGMQ
jgi:hypothetical protein